MIFKNYFFFISFLSFFLTACYLEIREPAPSIPKYKMSLASDHCANQKYKEDFSRYFFSNEDEGSAVPFAGQKLKESLNCIRFRVSKAQDLINHEFFNQEELVGFLNQKFIKTKDMEFIIDAIVDSQHLNKYILMKDSIIELISQSLDSPEEEIPLCRVKQVDSVAFSKKEVDVLLDFLLILSDFFVDVEEDSYYFFHQFFQTEEGLSFQGKSEFGQNLWFSEVLSEYFQESFPGYVSFLKETLAYEEEEFLEAPFWGNQPNPAWETRKEKILNETLTPLKEILEWSEFNNEDQVTFQNVKYMMLNIRLTQAIFSIYDRNKNQVLDSEELSALDCFIKPFVSFIVSSRVEKESQFIKDLYRPEKVSKYIINEQTLPVDEPSLSYIWFSLKDFVDSEEFSDLSYADVSRLVSALFFSTYSYLK